MISPSANYLLRHEIIGLGMSISRSCNISQEKIKGIIVDETRNTLLVKQNNSIKRVAKGCSSFMFNLGGTLVEVEGNTLIGRPEDRVKKKNKK